MEYQLIGTKSINIKTKKNGKIVFKKWKRSKDG